MTTMTEENFEELLAAARELAQQRHARGTSTAYSRAFRAWARWAERHELSPLPATPAGVGAYVVHLQRRGLATPSIHVYAYAIAAEHHATQHPSPLDAPLVRDALAALRRRAPVRPLRRSEPVSPEQIHALVDIQARIRGDLWRIRNRAMLLLGFGAALRRSELIALDVADLRFHHDGRALTITIRRSKTDPDGKRQHVTVPSLRSDYCPVAAVRAWLAARPGAFAGEDPAGALFLSPRGVRVDESTFYRSFRRWCKSAGIIGQYTPHSLMAGFVTAAYLARADEQAIRQVTRHARHDTFLSYVRPLEAVERAPLALVAL